MLARVSVWRDPWRVLAIVGVASSPAAAEEVKPALGDTAWALPGIVRVGVPNTGTARVAVAGDAGYGLTASQAAGDGAHHRLNGSAAVGVAPLPELELSLRFLGRYDRHSVEGEGSYSGMVGDPRALARLGTSLGSDFALGVELGAWAPGESAPSVAFDALTFDAKFLLAYRAPSGPTIAALAGFRLDRSGNAAPPRERIRFGDRVALGLSDHNAALVGLGVAYPIGATEVLGEVSADFLVGNGPPSLTESPIRLSGGVRHALSPAFSLFGLAEWSPSARPAIGASASLVPIEPLFGVSVGIRYRFLSSMEKAPAAVVDEPSRARPPEEVARPASVTLRVESEDGTPIPTAHVVLRVGRFEHEADLSEELTIEDVPPGRGTLVVTAEGFLPSETERGFEAGKAEEHTVRLKPAIVPGEVRGLIRSFGGRGLSASIQIEPGGFETQSDAEGQFRLQVPPGEYEIVVRASRYKEQRRKVQVEENGVTVLNAELFEEKR